ncbi:unnamed protein product [Choristocarpus tenellus]
MLKPCTVLFIDQRGTIDIPHCKPHKPHPSGLSFTTFSAVNYALAVVLDGVTLASFACHIISLWMSLVAFSLVIVLWSNTLNPPRRVFENSSGDTHQDTSKQLWGSSLSLSPTALFVGAVDVIVLVSTVTLLTTWRFPSAYSRPYLILVVTYSVTLFLLAYWLVVYGLRLQRRVVSHPRWEPLDRRQRVKILCRINGVLVVCAACFLLRIAVLSSAFFLWSRQRALNTNHLLFEVLARWIPGLVPGGALLYIMRKTGRDGGGQASQSMRVNAIGPQLSEPLLPQQHTGGRGRGTDGETRGAGVNLHENIEENQDAVWKPRPVTTTI